MYNDFRDMPLWKIAMKAAVDIFKLTDNLPRKEDYGFTSQIRRAALSISANIAEGFGRIHTKDKLHFYFYARGSVTETLNHLEYGNRVSYINEEDYKTQYDQLEKIHFELNRLIKSFKSKS